MAKQILGDINNDGKIDADEIKDALDDLKDNIDNIDKGDKK